MSIEIRDVGDEVFEALLALVGAYVASAISKGLIKRSLGTPDHIDGMVKLAIALGLGAALVDMAQTKGLLPKLPFGGTDTTSATTKVNIKLVGNEIFEAIFALLGACLVSRASKGLIGKSFYASESIEGIAKLSVALGLGATAVSYGQEYGWLPSRPFKKTN